MLPDFETCFRAMQSRDPRFDGWFYVAVVTTRIYCRPSCPATHPRRRNVRFLPTAAAAQAEGFRACLRCRPDAVPGSPQWNLRADVAGRAMRLIGDGVVDREGVAGLARRLSYSPRHLRRVLLAELGAAPISLARAQRAHTARILIETSTVPFGHVAFAAGFSSLRQFNATVRDIFAMPPRELRRRAQGQRDSPRPSALHLRLPYRAPLHADGLLRFLAERAVPGVEEVVDRSYRRSLRLPYGVGVAQLTPQPGFVRCELRLSDLRDLTAAVARCRSLFDLDADPLAIDTVLAHDPLLAPLVGSAAGMRVPGAADGPELAVRAVLGQRITVSAARSLAGRMAAALGEPLPAPWGSLRVTFPSPAALASADDALLPLPRMRRATLRTLSGALAAGRLDIGPGVDRDELRRSLLAISGVGPWTASYIMMRAAADSDAFPASDHGVLSALRCLGLAGDPAAAERRSQRWRPWRAYAVQHLWASLDRYASGPPPDTD